MRFKTLIPRYNGRRYIVCLDIGFRNTGIVVYDIRKKEFTRYVYIPTEIDESAKYKSWDSLRCCQEIYEGIFELLIETVGLQQIVVIAAELPTGAAQSARANSAMGMSVAVLACILSELRHRGSKVPFEPISPLEIKRLIRPKGKVEKKEIQKYIEKRYGSILPDKEYIREHVADAMACIDVLKAKFSLKYFQ